MSVYTLSYDYRRKGATNGLMKYGLSALWKRYCASLIPRPHTSLRLVSLCHSKDTVAFFAVSFVPQFQILQYKITQ